MTTMTKLKLPGSVAAYFEADSRDGKAIAQCFTKHAVVKDEGRTYSGSAAIMAWTIEASAKYSYTSEPVGVKELDGAYEVTSHLTGNFPGSPVDLRFIFRLQGGKIASLEIAP
jgi:hypothetical protein